MPLAPPSASSSASRTLLAAAAALLLAPPVAGQCLVERFEEPVGTGGSYTADLALSGDLAVVGNGGGGFSMHPVFLHERLVGGWTTSPVPLAPPDLVTIYGWSVDADGDTVVVAGQDLDAFDECAYVFERDGGVWSLAQALLVPGTTPYLYDGLTVDIEGDSILLANEAIGRVHSFDRVGGRWVPGPDLPAPTSPVLNVGYDLVRDADRAAVGGAVSVDGVFGFGRAWLHERRGGTWTELAELDPVGEQPGDGTGEAIAMRGDVVALGAGRHDHGDPTQLANAGVVFVFEEAGGAWTQTATLALPGPRAQDRFGASVVLGDDVLLVGAPGRDLGAEDAGAVFRFRRTPSGWLPAGVPVTSATPAPDAGFGVALALDGDTLLVGADTPVAAGAVEVLRGAVDADLWTPVGGGLSGAETPCASGRGAPALGGPASLSVDTAAPGASGWLIAGFQRIYVPFLGGVLVPNPGVLIPVVTDGAGEASFAWTWPAQPLAPPALWSQWWIPDAGAPFGWSASEGMRVSTP